MSEQKHTPGPWTLDEDDDPYSFEFQKDGAILGCVCGPDDFPCADEDNYDDLLNETRANARVIVAAPDLLEACERALQFITNGIEFGYITMPDKETPDPAHECPDVLRAAIARAKGEAG
jgi:hypothetical protein